VSARLLPIMSGHRVLRLGGGNPCFQRAYNRFVLMVNPELLDF